jgi:hypothetical protein
MTLASQALDRLFNVVDLAGELARCTHVPSTPLDDHRLWCAACGALSVRGADWLKPTIAVRMELARRGAPT